MTGTGKTPDSIIVSSETSAPPFTGYADDIKEALDILLLMTDELESEGAVTGKFLAEFAAVNQISISFASETPCGDGAAGCHQGYAFNGTIASVITVLDTYKDNIYAAAAITAHEILHAVWHKDYYEYYFGQKPAPVVGMPIPGGGVRHSYSEDHEYNTKKTGGEIWNQLKQSYKNVYDSKNLWRQPDYDAMYFVGVTEDVAKGYLNSIYGYDFEYKY